MPAGQYVRTPRPPTLNRREALLLRELARFPGGVVEWPVLAEAIGADSSLDISRSIVTSRVQSIRRKFGRDKIVGTMGEGGYYLAKDALRTT